MVKTFVAILGATGMLSLVAVGWNADTPSAPAQETEITTSAEACRAIRAAGLCERDLGGKCTPEQCHAAKGCDPAQCDPSKCPGHGPAGCNPALCHSTKQADSAGQPAHCDLAKCDWANCQCHGPDGCDPSKCPGHGPEGCDPAKCPGHGPEGCNPALCHSTKQTDSAGQPAHCDPAKCDPANCPGHGPDGCDPSKCPGHAAADSPAESKDRASEDAAPQVRVRHGGCSRGCRGHGTSQP